MTPEELEELHELQKKSFGELMHKQEDEEAFLKLVNINSAANTFYKILTKKMEDKTCPHH